MEESEFVLKHLRRLPSIFVLEDEQGANPEEIKEARESEDFEMLMKQQQKRLYRIYHDNFEFKSPDDRREFLSLDILGRFDEKTWDLVKLSGFLRYLDCFNNHRRHEFGINPLKTPSGLIYLFEGSCSFFGPIGFVPVYGVPSGRIIRLNPIVPMGILKEYCEIFKNVQIEYRDYAPIRKEFR